MKKTILFLGCCLLGWGSTQLFAQQGFVAAGGEATGTGGTVSYSVGQVDYFTATGATGVLTLGLQQPFESQAQRSVGGVLTYDNAVNTPLTNCAVMLRQGMAVVSQVNTDLGGGFLFNNPELGAYNLYASSTKPWLSVNAADALLILRHFTGSQPLAGLRLTAADVDGSGFVNATDGLVTLKRFAGIGNNFANGDWAFENPSVVVAGNENLVVNFKGLLYGDVNGDYVPGITKYEPTMFLENQGIQLVNEDQIVQLPIRISQSLDFAALSLVLDFPANNIEILGAEAAYDNQTLVYNVLNGQLRLGWYTLQPKTFSANDVVVTLTVKLKNFAATQSLGFELNPESSLADYNGVKILNKSLTIPSLVDGKQGFSLNQNVPNPFNNTTQITYTMPDDGYVKLELLDVVGKQISVLQEGQESAGIHNYTFSGNSLSNGVYFYRMTVNTESQQYSQTKRMVISR